jgi:hypothetical protein
MVAIGDENPGDPMARQLGQIFLTRLHRIDAEVAIRMPNKVAVEIVAMGLRKPRPGEDIRQDLTHFVCPYLLRAFDNPGLSPVTKDNQFIEFSQQIRHRNTLTSSHE